MPALLISDLHLSPERPEVTRAFFNFLKTTASSAEELYILGDLFEAWIGDDDPSSLAVQVQTQLRKLASQGVKLYFQHGNRDFMVGKRFLKNTLCTLLPDYYVTNLAGTPTVLLHGDTLCTDDKEYQKFRRRYRHPLIKWVFKKLPLKKRQQIAADLRQKSTEANANKSESIMDVNPQAVEMLMAKTGVKVMIHGHTHRPMKHNLADGERIVLGDWHKQGWYIDARQESGISLHSFNITH